MVSAVSALEDLSDYDRKLLVFVRAGLTDEEIAENLRVSPVAARARIQMALGKLGVRSRAELPEFGGAQDGGARRSANDFTELEAQIFELLRDRKKTREIARELGLTYNTAREHIFKMCVKRGVRAPMRGEARAALIAGAKRTERAVQAMECSHCAKAIDLQSYVQKRLRVVGHLTDDEIGLVLHVLRGLRVQDIARIRKNSENTIKVRMSYIYRKLDVSSHGQLFHLLFPL